MQTEYVWWTREKMDKEVVKRAIKEPWNHILLDNQQFTKKNLKTF